MARQSEAVKAAEAGRPAILAARRLCFLWPVPQQGFVCFVLSRLGQGDMDMAGRWKTCVRAAACASVVWGLGLITFVLPASAALPLPPELEQAWRATKLPDEALSLVVQEIDGPRLLAVNADTPRNPASVMKLVTTWAALSELGPDHVWRTALLTDPGMRLGPEGVLPGPLYLRASGDPMMQIQDFWALLRELRVRGVRQIRDVVVDRSIFGTVAIDPGAFDGALDRAYNASPDALVVGLGAVRLLFIPDPAQRIWRPIMDPPLPGVTFEGSVQWSDARCPGPPAVATVPVLTTQGVSIRLSGQVAGSCGEFSLYRLVLNQSRFAAEVFRHLWTEMGGVFSGQMREGKVPPDAVLLAERESPPLGEIIRTINKRSNNVMARLLLLALGVERGPRPVTASSSAEAARAVLAQQGLDMPELRLDNGSGLSRVSRVSANSLARLLTHAWHSPLMPEYVSSLAIAGVDGTVRRRLRNNKVQGMAHLKTGSLRDARAIAGYVLGASGKLYVLVALVNDAQSQTARDFYDVLLDWLSAR